WDAPRHRRRSYLRVGRTANNIRIASICTFESYRPRCAAAAMTAQPAWHTAGSFARLRSLLGAGWLAPIRYSVAAWLVALTRIQLDLVPRHSDYDSLVESFG